MIANRIRIGVPEGESPIETHHSDVEVEAYADASVYSELVIKTVEVELTVGE